MKANHFQEDSNQDKQQEGMGGTWETRHEVREFGPERVREGFWLNGLGAVVKLQGLGIECVRQWINGKQCSIPYGTADSPHDRDLDQ
jgi:hypothetical protein